MTTLSVIAQHWVGHHSPQEVGDFTWACMRNVPPPDREVWDVPSLLEERKGWPKWANTDKAPYAATVQTEPARWRDAKFLPGVMRPRVTAVQLAVKAKHVFKAMETSLFPNALQLRDEPTSEVMRILLTLRNLSLTCKDWHTMLSPVTYMYTAYADVTVLRQLAAKHEENANAWHTREACGLCKACFRHVEKCTYPIDLVPANPTPAELYKIIVVDGLIDSA